LVVLTAVTTLFRAKLSAPTVAAPMQPVLNIVFCLTATGTPLRFSATPPKRGAAPGDQVGHPAPFVPISRVARQADYCSYVVRSRSTVAQHRVQP
jgi:hypothetical protein